MSRQAGTSTDAINRPVARPNAEIHTGDMATRAVPDVNMDAIEERDDEIILTDGEQFDRDYAAALAFTEEPVTIVLSRSSEKFAPAILDFHVNGKTVWLPVGRPVTVKRKYVEVIARAQPYDVRTSIVKHEDREENKVERHTINKYPFSVIRDDNPKGHEWLAQVMRES